MHSRKECVFLILQHNTSKGRALKKSALPKVTNNISYINFPVDTKFETVSLCIIVVLAVSIP